MDGVDSLTMVYLSPTHCIKYSLKSITNEMNVIEQRQALKRRKRGREREREGKREEGREREREGEM